MDFQQSILVPGTMNPIIQWTNRFGRMLARLGISPANRSAASLLDAARRAADYDDFGEASFREGLDVLLKSLREDANLTFTGWLHMHGVLVWHLENRLRIQQSLAEHPEILNEEIRQPIFITGLPRTGSTLLQRLLAADHNNRPLLHWEAIRPAPPPIVATYQTDPRIIAAEKILKRQRVQWPGFDTIHYSAARLPEECIALLMNSFTHRTFGLLSRIPQYNRWIVEQDMVPVYRYFRLQLQLLQLHVKGRWVLKAPAHLPRLDALLTVFPDARIVQTHRDPLRIVPSILSLLMASRSRYEQDGKWQASHEARSMLGVLSKDAKKAMVIRDASNPWQFCDAKYADLVQDPIRTVRNIYDHFGLEISPDFENAMNRWLAENPHNKHGVHRYRLEDWGLRPEEINVAFSDYCARFDIKPE